MHNSSEAIQARRLWNYILKCLKEKKHTHIFLASTSLLQEYGNCGHRQGRMKMEAEMGVMCLPAKERPGLPAATTREERGMEQICLQDLQREPALLTPGFHTEVGTA